MVAPFGAGNGTTLPITFNTAPQIPADGFYSFLGTIENAEALRGLRA